METQPSNWPRLVPPTTKDDLRQHKEKRPRHRHTADQLAALNLLYDENDHPPLDERIALAKAVGLETKAVNAWFQNKRASLVKKSSSIKKRAKAVPSNLPPISTLLAVSAPSSLPTTPRYTEFDDELVDDDFSAPALKPFVPVPSTSSSLESQQELFYAGNPDHAHSPDASAMPRKLRMRPSAYQTEELRKLFDENPHPSKEEREELGDKIGMRHQSVTNWFQNQRSGKKRKEDEEAPALASNLFREIHSRATLPPASTHPSLALPPSSTHPSLPKPKFSPPQRSFSVPASPQNHTGLSTPEPSPRSSVTSYRPRRTRPEPHQLDALRRLLNRTHNPSIEERGVVALEIGMDLSKVTNWFRNLRQTARKRAKRGVHASRDSTEADGDRVTSLSDSRAGTPSFSSASSTLNDAERLEMEVCLDIDDERVIDWDMASDEDDCKQEAITPSSDRSTSFSPFGARTGLSSTNVIAPMARHPEPYHHHRLDESSDSSRVKKEDALLLLSFHQHVMAH